MGDEDVVNGCGRTFADSLEAQGNNRLIFAPKAISVIAAQFTVPSTDGGGAVGPDPVSVGGDTFMLPQGNGTFFGVFEYFIGRRGFPPLTPPPEWGINNFGFRVGDVVTLNGLLGDSSMTFGVNAIGPDGISADPNVGAITQLNVLEASGFGQGPAINSESCPIEATVIVTGTGTFGARANATLFYTDKAFNVLELFVSNGGTGLPPGQIVLDSIGAPPLIPTGLPPP